MKKILFSLVVLFISISLAQSLDSPLNGDKDLIKTDPKRYVQQYNEYVREQINSKRYVKQYNEYVRTQWNSKRDAEKRLVIQENNAVANKLNISASDMQAMKDKAKAEHTRDAAKAFFDEKIPFNITDDKLEKSEHLKTVGLQKNSKRYVNQYNEYVRTQWNSKRDAEPIDKRYVQQYNEYVRTQWNSKRDDKPIDKRYVNQYNEYVRTQWNSKRDDKPIAKRYVKQYNEYVRTQWNSKRDAELIKQTDTQPLKIKRENCGEYIRFSSPGSNADCYEYVRNRDRGKLKIYD